MVLLFNFQEHQLCEDQTRGLILYENLQAPYPIKFFVIMLHFMTLLQLLFYKVILLLLVPVQKLVLKMLMAV